MSLMWQDPPSVERAVRGREKTPRRKEIDAVAQSLEAYPGRWARLWDFPDEKEARSQESFMRSAVGKGFSLVIRANEEGGYSLFGMKRLPVEEASQAETQERDPTFQ